MSEKDAVLCNFHVELKIVLIETEGIEWWLPGAEGLGNESIDS